MVSAGRAWVSYDLGGETASDAYGLAVEMPSTVGKLTNQTQEVYRLRIKNALILSLALALTGAPAMAQQQVTNTWIGMTGLVIAPSAEIAPEQQLIASFNWIDSGRRDTNIWSVIFGVTEGLEAGVAHVSRGSSSDTVGNFKYDLNLPRLTQNPQAPALAIGVWDLGDSIDRAWYLVLSDEFARQTPNARWSIGLADSSGGALNGLFAGVGFEVGEQSLLQIDHDGDNLNAALRVSLSDRLSGGIGFIDGDIAANIALQTAF